MRLIEIDYNAKQQISETIIHRPEKPSQIKFNSSGVVQEWQSVAAKD